MNQVVEAHKKEFAVDPNVSYCAPGTIALFGEHAESAGGTVMIGAIERFMTVAVSRRRDNSLRFYSSTFQERKKTSISTLKWRREDRWANNSKGVIYGLLQMGFTVPGLEFTIGGDVPSGVGLGSSTAICVATAAALNDLLDLQLSQHEIIRLAVEAETLFQQRPAGAAAAAAALMIQPGQLMLWESSSWRYRLLPFFSGNIVLLWIDPQVPTTEEEIEMVQQRHEEARGCLDFLSDTPVTEGLLRLGDDIGPAGLGEMSEEVRRGCKHLRDDEARLQDAVQAIEQDDPVKFGKCLQRSHESLRDLYEISNPEIDWLVRRRDTVPGVLGGRRTGIGASASIIILMEQNALDGYMEKLQEYERIFGFHPIHQQLALSGGTIPC
ncbi:MAG: galactokinase [Spirochaeta sp.]